MLFALIIPYATNNMLLGNGVAAKRNDVIMYPNFFLFRNSPIASRFDFCSFPTIPRKYLLMDLRKNLPTVAPVAPTSAKERGSSVVSSA